MDVSPEVLDREIAETAAEVRRRKRELRRTVPGTPEAAALEVDPFRGRRRVSSKTTFLELAERAGDPFADAARPWLYALTLERVLWPDTVRAARGWTAPTIDLETRERIRVSPRELCARILAETDPRRARLLGDAFAHGAEAASDAARIEAERRVEAIRLLTGGAAGGADAIEILCEPTGAVAALATAILDRTRDLVELEASAFTDPLGAAVAREAGSGWPAHLTARWLYDLFGGTGLTDGLSLELGVLPGPRGGASFARALAAFGAAFAEADVPRAAPFVMARPPFDLRRARRAALFGGLAADPLFHRRALGLGRDRALAQARTMARALLVSLRLDAARVLLRGALSLPARARTERFEEVTSRAWGAPIPASLAGLVPALSPEDPTRLAGVALAFADRRGLVERFDEDWFQSPHAAHALRDEQGTLPPSTRTTGAELEAGLDELVRVAGDVVGG